MSQRKASGRRLNIMKSIVVMVLALLTMGMPVMAATEQEAAEITSEYDRLSRLWLSEMRLAQDARERDLISRRRPDPAEYANKLKQLLRADLAHEWSLKYGAWLLQYDAFISTSAQRALLNAVQSHHLRSSKLGPFCVAMINLNDFGKPAPAGKLTVRSQGMRLLEEIKQTNPDAKVQGQASLSLSIMLASLGDDARIMTQRIQNLREAIIKSADVRVGNTSVAEIARDELFKINHLSKGRTAPNIVGVDSGARPLNLSDFRGKVVMLVFWSSWDPQAAKALELLRNKVSTHIDAPFVVLGVNRDSLANLRALEADRIVTWRNFTDPKQIISKEYRVSSWPYCMILDQQGVIRYKGAVGSFADVVASDLLADNK
jgi:peroxiredoxin